jgi:LPS-assembly protein
MGRRVGPFFAFLRPLCGRATRSRATNRGGDAIRFVLISTLLLCVGGFANPTHAQTLSQRLADHAGGQNNGPPQQALLRADSLVYDRTQNTVTAVGHVQIYYQGRILQADRVIYDRNADRVFAEGRAKLTEPDGTIAYGSRFELTQDLKSGFIDAIRANASNQTYFTAARAERSQGETTIFERGAYTACQPCRQHPERQPLWQVQAKRIIHDNARQTIYYEDAELEFYGVPILYLPYFSTPDPSVTRKSGILAPTYAYKSQLGFGLSVPYFFDLAPNYDLTVTPTVYTRQGFMLSGEWRHRLLNGSYDIRASGIFQADPSAFEPQPFGAGNLKFRGAVESNGQFYINPDWKFGWNVAVATDKFYNSDYGENGETLASNFFGFNTSTVYLTGQGAQSYFDLRGYYFQALSANVLQSQEPEVAPVLNYNRAFELDPKDTDGIGGQVEIDANFTHLDQTLADYQSIGAESLDQAFNLYDVCEINKVPTFTPGACALRGIAGDYTNATVTASWQRKFIDPIGEVWTPFAFAHLSGTNLDLNTSNSVTFSSPSGVSTISNAAQPGLLGLPNQSLVGEAIPGAGTEWRYPLIDQTSWSTMIFEPIAQIVVRPDENPSAAQINEDSQSLVFDDTDLFDWNRFSGDDRFEGGTRVNYGAQYALMMDNGGYANLMVGQSYQLDGLNSYAMQDALAVGLASGLDQRASAYVTRLQFSPSSNFSFIAKDNFDPTTFASQRIDVMGDAHFADFEGSLEYARYVAQPAIGNYLTREGLSPTLKLNFAKDFSLSGDVVLDLSRHLFNEDLGTITPVPSIAGVGVSAGYSNDCATVSVSYTSVFQADLMGADERNQTVALSLQLRTLGDTQIRSGLADVKVEDGLEDLH